MRSGAASVSSSGLLTLSQVGASGPSQPVLSSGPELGQSDTGTGRGAGRQPGPKRSAGFAVGIVAGSILLGAALFGLVALRHDDNKDGNRPANEGTTSLPTTANKVTWTISSEPAGATVVRATDQRILGRTLAQRTAAERGLTGSDPAPGRLCRSRRHHGSDRERGGQREPRGLVTTPPPAARSSPPCRLPSSRCGGSSVAASASPIKPAAPAAESLAVSPARRRPQHHRRWPHPSPIRLRQREETPHARILVD